MFELIVAHDSERGIAKNRTIPWNIKDDMKFFREKTTNNAIIMGKNTFFSLPDQQPLPKRLNVVLTRNPEMYKSYEEMFPNIFFTSDENIHFVLENNRETFSKKYNLNPEFSIFFIGGNEIYKKYSSICDVLWITTINNSYNCDLFLSLDVDEKYYDSEIIINCKDFMITKFERR
uniref:dihydrofolate reductase n=1 Tax=viral metagenome TaxID=1070528 RepID=A0A6C0DX00_9ZZZZ